jgi:hypothetical protein
MKPEDKAVAEMGIDDAILRFTALDGCRKEKMLFAVWCANRARHLMHDTRSTNAVDVAKRYAYGLATETELANAVTSAVDATRAGKRGGEWAALWAAEACAKVRVADAAAGAAMAITTEAEGEVIGPKRDAAWMGERRVQMQELTRVCDCIEQGIDPYPV